MIFVLAKDGAEKILCEVDEMFDGYILSLPDIADRTGGEAAGKRLFPAPMDATAAHDEHHVDWREFVRPELEKLFQSASAAVRKELEASTERKGGRIVRIQEESLDRWIHCLARARLVLAEEQAFTEEELAGVKWEVENQRDLELLKMSFYGELETVFIRRGWGFEWDDYPPTDA